MADYAAILESDLFTFICGPDEKPVVVHSHAFISVSEVLKAMVTNGMKETNDKTAKLPEVSGRIFQLFSAWCYSGTYRVVAHIKKTEEPVPVLSTLVKRRNPGREPAHLKTTTSDCELLCRWKDGAKAAQGSLSTVANYKKLPSDDFAKRMYPTEGMSHWETRDHLNRLQPPDAPTSEVSAHASLYILAEMYKVEPLKALCLHKLHRDLMALDLSGETVQDVGRMLESTYANTSDDDENGSGVGKDLRDLVVAYTSWKAGELVKLGAFRSMMSQGGEYVGEMVMPALCSREQ